MVLQKLWYYRKQPKTWLSSIVLITFYTALAGSPVNEILSQNLNSLDSMKDVFGLDELIKEGRSNSYTFLLVRYL